MNLDDDQSNTIGVVPFCSITMQSLELSCQETDVSFGAIVHHLTIDKLYLKFNVLICLIFLFLQRNGNQQCQPNSIY